MLVNKINFEWKRENYDDVEQSSVVFVCNADQINFSQAENHFDSKHSQDKDVGEIECQYDFWINILKENQNAGEKKGESVFLGFW